jgi:pimeloyl-ACP methyl ester carboxylesterase
MTGRRITSFLATVGLLVAFLGAAAPVQAEQVASGGPPAHAGPPPHYFVDESTLPFDALVGLPSDRHWGVHGGAGYRIEVPHNWNGDLVLWARGFVPEQPELTVQNHPMRAFLLQAGYAWAASSYAKNDYNVAQGVKDTHALTKLFNGIVSQPERVYLTGASMGGHITAVAIEQYPDAYDGALPICGVMGDYELFDYFLDFNLVAAALAGVETTYPADPDVWTGETVPAIQQQLATVWPLVLTEEGQRLRAVTELRSGGVRPLTDVAFVAWADFLFTFGGEDGTVPGSVGIVVDNTDRVYRFETTDDLSPDEQALNDAVLRVAKHPGARNGKGLANVPVVQGTPPVPVLTLHTLGDLFVPFSMQQVYAERVAGNGLSELVVQRAIRAVGHCDFAPDELVPAFLELVAWVEHGVKPAGDDVLTPEVVADPFYGCTFTTATRPFTPPCP